MRKLTVLAMLALLLSVPAFAVQRNFAPVANATGGFAVAGAGGPTSTNNDDTCDIGNAPAATLLLPYFEVDFRSPQTTARTTLFTITNVSNLPQIAHVVVWTDWSFPAMDFNIFLTGYDVQGINLYDLFARGIIAPPSGTSSNTTVPTNPTTGSQPANTNTTLPANGATTNPAVQSFANCTALPGGPIPFLADLQAIFTAGIGSGTGIPCAVRVGGTHTNAVGYITVDVNANCNTSLPNVNTYFTQNILFDNVLIGDYQDINPNPATGNFAGGNPLVPIRAIPEGGLVGSDVPTNLPYTFYDRYTSGLANRHIDRRQPLPAVFAARYIQGGTGQFNTNYKIWREGISTGTCTTSTSTATLPIGGAILNSSLPFTEFVRFDEHENASIAGGGLIVSPAPPGQGLPETSSNPTSGITFPLMPSAANDVAGWMFLNLDSAQMTRTSPVPVGVTAGTTARASQNWVIVSMFAEGRYSVDFDAAWLGNGCSAPVARGIQIGPSSFPQNGGVLVCPPPLTPGAGCAASPVSNNVTPP